MAGFFLCIPQVEPRLSRGNCSPVAACAKSGTGCGTTGLLVLC